MKWLYKKVNLIFLRCLCLFLCMAGNLLMAVEAFGFEMKIGYVLTGIGAGCLLLGIGEVKNGRWKFWFYGWNILLFGLGVFRWKQVWNGYLAVENSVRGKLNEYYEISLALRKLELENEKGEWFVLLVFLLLIGVLGNLVVKKGRIAMLTLVTVLLFILELLCGCRFQDFGLYLTAGGILVLFAMRYGKEGRNQKVLYKTGLWALGIVLSLAVVCGFVIGPLLYRHTEDMNEKLYNAVQQGTDKITSAVNSQNGLFGNHTPTADGSLNNYPVNQDQTTDLKVTLEEKPEYSMYLRGFVGDTYEGTYWHRIDTKEFENAFPQEGAGCQIQNILYRYIGTQAGQEEKKAIIERLDPGGEYGYVPYGFETPDDSNVYGDSYYSSAEKSNTYTGYVNWKRWIGEGAATQSESEIESRYKEYVARQYLKVPVNGLERLKEYCGQQDLSSVQEVIDFVVPEVQEGKSYSMELAPVPEGEDFAEYFFFDQKKGYCIHFATTAVLMFRLLGVPARYVTGYVVSPSTFKQDGDRYTAEILDTQAHAWVEIYRSGKGWIPVEVTPGYGTFVNGDENGEAMEDVIPQTVPAEISPAPQADEITQVPEKMDESEQEENRMPDLQEAETGEKVNPNQEGLNSVFDDGSEKKKEESVAGKILSLIWKVLLCMAVVSLVFGGCWGLLLANRTRIVRNRRAVFFQKNSNKGICEISYGLSQMLRDAGLEEIDSKEKFDDVEYGRKIEDKLECIDSGEYVEFIRLVQQAAYGRERMTEEQRQKCYTFYRKIAVFLGQGMKKTKKFWWKYMKGYEIS